MLKDNLIMLRKLNGYSQEQIAEKIGISRQAYAKWESGATVPDIERAALLAEVYGVTIDGLLRTEDGDGLGVLPPAPKGKNIWGSCFTCFRIPLSDCIHWRARAAATPFCWTV